MDTGGAEEFDSAAPFDAYRVSLPQEEKVLLTYNAHKPTIEALTLKSEKGRTIFAEAIMENRRLGTLADLCIAKLASGYGPIMANYPNVAKDARTRRIFYDSIDIDTPLDEIYTINDELFWKRLVLAKSVEQSLKFKDDSFDWKSLGVSLKYAELVEKCPAEFWPTEKMETLATLIKKHVKEFHIRKLQPLQDYMFEKYLGRDSDTDKSDSTEVSSSSAAEIQSIDGSANEFAGEEEQQEPITLQEGQQKSESDEKSDESIPDENTMRLRMFKSDWMEFEERRAEQKQQAMEERKEERRKRREAQQERRDRREEKRRERREQAILEKPKKIRVKDVFNLPVDEPEDVEGKIVDKRNLERLIKQRKNYDYPDRHCHHIDLSFVRLFDNITDFSIIFHPPNLQDKYHSRYFKFSYDDVQRLASGISEIHSLRIFRLRESHMDRRKLVMLTNVLRHMDVEVIDFGYDYLQDDCDDAIADLFLNTTITIKSLELEGNSFKTDVLEHLAYVLRNYEGHLEYLGLAHNPLQLESIHALCRMLPYINQIEHLNLTAIQLCGFTLRCCIANELLRCHKRLRQLDLVGCSIARDSAEEIMKAMEVNSTLLYFDCRGCDLPIEIEMEIEICLRRNHYILENPYLGDEEKTAEEIQQFCERIKNPILLNVLQYVDEEKQRYDNRPDIAERFSIKEQSFNSDTQTTISQWSDMRVTGDRRVSFPEIEENSSHSVEVEEPPFVYNPNEFTLEQIQKHVYVPGKRHKDDTYS